MMKIAVCHECGTACVLAVGAPTCPPQRCPYVGVHAEWVTRDFPDEVDE